MEFKNWVEAEVTKIRQQWFPEPEAHDEGQAVVDEFRAWASMLRTSQERLSLLKATVQDVESEISKLKEEGRERDFAVFAQ